jgi:hypothetical protein
MGDTVQGVVKRAADTATAQIDAKAAQVRSKAESETLKAADAASAAARSFDNGSLQQEAARHVAASLHQAADILGASDLTQVADTARRFTRDNPAVVLGAAALVGFAAVRFLKSSDPMPRASPSDEANPWVGHVSATDPSELRVPGSAGAMRQDVGGNGS